MSDITDKERGLDGGSRGVPQDAGTAASLLSESRFWTRPKQIHRVVFPSALYDAEFDFRPNDSGGWSGVVSGRGMADAHLGSYKIIRSTADSFTMKVTIGTMRNTTEDMDATLVIDQSGASVNGKLKGEARSVAHVPVKGSGTSKDPFRASFPDQDLVWFLP